MEQYSIYAMVEGDIRIRNQFQSNKKRKDVEVTMGNITNKIEQEEKEENSKERRRKDLKPPCHYAVDHGGHLAQSSLYRS
jgi:predicted DNA-binding helix-hairpin-helix protein